MMSDYKNNDNKKEEATKKPTSKAKEIELEFLNKDINDILKDPSNYEFKKILIKTIEDLRAYKPYLDKDKVEEELDYIRENVSIEVEIENEADLELYNKIFDSLQAYRDRVVSLLTKAETESYLFDTYYNHLLKIWMGKFSKLNSEKRREGEAEYILDFMFKEKEQRKALHNSLKSFLNNIDRKKETVSRKFSIIQEVHRVIGISYGDSPEKFKDAMSAHRKNYNDRVQEYHEHHKNEKGWEKIPSEEEI